ncbi:hypothetical protein OAA23_00840 [bacterium]|nr:hypothetical protein [bacterium]
MNTKQFIQLLEAEVEDFVQTQAEKIVSFEDDPMAYILQKYPSLKATLEDLMTSNFEDYITGIYVMAPKPTTFKILLHNGQHFFLIYARDSYIAKIAGKKYYLLNIGEQEYAIKSIADLLTMGMPPGAEGPDEEVDNDSSAGSDDTPDEAPADDTGGDEEELAETKEEKPKRKTPLKFKILKEGEEKKKSPLKFKIISEIFNRSKSIKAAEDFVNNSQFAKDNGITKFKSGKYINRINSSQEKDLDKIKDALISHFGISNTDIEQIEPGQGPASKDSVPGFKLTTPLFGEVYIAVSTGKKGTGGKKNERDFNAAVNQYASKENPITVKLVSKDKSITVENVSKAIDVAGSTKDKLKADSALLNSEGEKISNISLKQPEGFRWASLSNDSSPFRKNFIDASLNNPDFPITLKQNPNAPEGKYLMYKEGTDDRITIVIVKNAPISVDDKNIFGTDDPKTIVVGRTFKPEDFKFDEGTNTLTINADHIYENMKEIEGTPFEPVFVVAQHQKNPYGLDFRSYPSFMAKLPKKGTGIEINYDELVS